MEISNGTRAKMQMVIKGVETLNLLDKEKVKEYLKKNLVQAVNECLAYFTEQTGEIPTHVYMDGNYREMIREYLNDTLTDYNKAHPNIKRKHIGWDEPVVIGQGVILQQGCSLTGASVIIVSWRRDDGI